MRALALLTLGLSIVACRKDDESKKKEAASMAVTVNQWTGSVVFAGAAVAPTYTLNAPGETELTGKLTVTASLRGLGDVSKKLASAARLPRR